MILHETVSNLRGTRDIQPFEDIFGFGACLKTSNGPAHPPIADHPIFLASFLIEIGEQFAKDIQYKGTEIVQVQPLRNSRKSTQGRIKLDDDDLFKIVGEDSSGQEPCQTYEQGDERKTNELPN